MSEPAILTPSEKIERGTQRVIAGLEAQLHATDVARLEALAEVERLQARERELETALRDLVRMDEAQVFVKEPWDRVFAEAKTLLAAVSAEPEDDDG